MGQRLRIAHVREENTRAIVEHGEVRGTRSVRARLADDLEGSLVIQHPKDKGLALDMSVGVDDIGDGPTGVSRRPLRCAGSRVPRQPARVRTRLELAGLGEGERRGVELDRVDAIVVRPKDDEMFARGRSHGAVCASGAGVQVRVRLCVR
jgi:hypothetical protein